MDKKLIIFITFFALYTYLSYPATAPRDSGELSLAVNSLGIAHSPGYPLFIIVGNFLKKFFIFGNSIYRTNLVSCFFGALSIFLLSKISILSAFILGLMPIFIKQSVQCEVFTLHIFLVILIIYLLYKRKNLLLFFISGLATGNHHTVIFLFPALLYKRFSFFKKNLFKIISIFLLGMTINLFPLIRSRTNPKLNWGNPNNLKKLKNLILRKEFGTFSLYPGNKKKSSFILIAKNYLKIIIKNLGPFLLIIILGFKFLKDKIFWLIFYFFSTIFFLILSKPPPDDLSWTSIERFLIMGFIPFLFITKDFELRIPEKIRPVLYILLTFQIFHIPFNRYNFIPYDIGENTVKSAKNNSFIFLSEDVILFPVWSLYSIKKINRKIIPSPPPKWFIETNLEKLSLSPSEELILLFDRELKNSHEIYIDRKLFWQTGKILREFKAVNNGILFEYSTTQKKEIDYYRFYFFRSYPFSFLYKDLFTKEIIYRYAYTLADRAYKVLKKDKNKELAIKLYKKMYLIASDNPEAKKIYERASKNLIEKRIKD